MKLDEFDYELPEELIAQTPVEPRDSSRLLVYNKKSGDIECRRFFNILDYFNAGDVIVVNDTKVMKARLFAELGDRQIEVFLSKLLDVKGEKYTYEVMLRPAKKVKIGDKFAVGSVTGECLSKDVEDGTAVVRFDGNVESLGEIPLPTYIEEKCEDENRYQTVYAKEDKKGSVAAPTAGLHWTDELIQKAKDKGVVFCEVTLNVGLGTFRSVRTDNIQDHNMHSEYYEMTQETADIINNAKREGRRVICCGTTSVRTVESVYKRFGEMRACMGDTDIFIYPGFEFGTVDAMITNFHLPKSTLIMLVSAFIGTENALEMYKFAVKEKFRFFSFGDATLLM